VMRIGTLGMWLFSLADPTGLRSPLPKRRLRQTDLPRLIALAEHHGVLPAVISNMKRAEREFGAESLLAASPDERGSGVALEEAVANGRERLIRQAAFSLLLRQQLQDIARALSKKSLPAALLRGQDFADRLYPVPGLRTFTDIDLLVPAAALSEVEGVLLDIGYSQIPDSARKYADGYGEHIWCLPDRPEAKVEVHWNLVNSPSQRRRVSVRFEDLQFERSPAQGRLAQASTSSLLLIASVHAAVGHRFDRLQLLCDICQIARGAAGDIDGNWLAETLPRTGASLAVATALALSGRTLNEPKCTALLRQLDVPGGDWISRTVLTPKVVLHSKKPFSKIRRQLFREIMKRR